MNADIQAALVELYLVEKNGANYSVKEKINLYFTDNAIANPLQNAPATTIIANNTSSFSTGQIDVIAGREYYLSIGSVVYNSLSVAGTNVYYTDKKNSFDFEFILKPDSTFGSNLL